MKSYKNLLYGFQSFLIVYMLNVESERTKIVTLFAALVNALVICVDTYLSYKNKKDVS